MSVRPRNWGQPIVWACDTCGKLIDTQTDDFFAARAALRAELWINTKDGDGQWRNFCNECHQRKLRAMFEYARNAWGKLP